VLYYLSNKNRTHFNDKQKSFSLHKQSILLFEFQEVETVRIGDRLTFKIEIPDKTPYGIFARSCVAMAKVCLHSKFWESARLMLLLLYVEFRTRLRTESLQEAAA
jgi:hypothetical protein